MTWQPRAPRTNRGWILLLGSFVILMPLSLEMYILGMPAMAVGLGTDTVTMQLTMTALLFGAAAGQFIGGPLGDAVGRRGPILVGLSIFVVSMLSAAAATSVGMLIACRAGAGVGAGIAIVCANATVRDRYDGSRLVKSFAQIMVINAMAPVVGPPLGAFVMWLSGWRGLLAFSGILGLGILITAFRCYRVPPTAPTEHSGWLSRLIDDGKALAVDRNYLGYGLVVLLASIAFFATMAGSTFVLQADFGMSPQQYSIVLAVNSLGVVVASLITSRRVHIYGARPTLVVGLGVLILSGAVLLVSSLGSLVVLLVGLFALNIGVGLTFLSARALAPESHAERAGSAYAILGVSQFVVSGLAAPLSGLLPWSVQGSMALVVTVASLGAAAAFLITRRARPSLTPPTS